MSKIEKKKKNAAKNARAVAVLASVLVMPPLANAGLVDITLEKFDADINSQLPGGTVNYIFSLPDIAAISDATVNFQFRGYTAHADQANGDVTGVDVDAEGYSFGTWLDTIVGNDTISGPNFDQADYYQTVAGSATIPLADLLPRIADNQLTVSWDYGDRVFNQQDFTINRTDSNGDPLPDLAGDFGSVRLQYTTRDIAEPGSAALIGLGLAALGMRRRRKKG